MSKSIIDNNKQCYICKTLYNVHKHHIYEGYANRKKSEADGCWCYLCAYHHNMSNQAVHFNKDMELWPKRKTQLIWMKYYNKTEEEFIDRYGHSLL